MVQDEFPELKKRYWEQPSWARGYFCATVGSVTEETLRKYIESQELSDKDDIFKVEEWVSVKGIYTLNSPALAGE